MDLFSVSLKVGKVRNKHCRLVRAGSVEKRLGEVIMDSIIFLKELNIVRSGLGGLVVVSLAQSFHNLGAGKYRHVHSSEQCSVAQPLSLITANLAFDGLQPAFAY